jgi:hypothetical protein
MSGCIMNGRDRLHGCPEADLPPQAERVGIAVQILQALPMIRIGRPLPGHREVSEGGERLRTDQPGRGKDPGGGGTEVPVAAKVVFALEDFGIDATGQQVLQRRQAGGAGADDAPPRRDDCGLSGHAQ